MKRSNALKILSVILYEQVKRLDPNNNLALSEFIYSKKEWEEDADEILSKMEKLGMQPPSFRGKSGQTYTGWESED